MVSSLQYSCLYYFEITQNLMYCTFITCFYMYFYTFLSVQLQPFTIMTWKVRTSEENSITQAYYTGGPEVGKLKEGEERNVFVLALSWCWCSLKINYQIKELVIPQLGNLDYWSSSDHGGYDDGNRDFVAEAMKTLYPAVYKEKYCRKVCLKFKTWSTRKT